MTKVDGFIGIVGLGYWGKNILRNLFELNVLHTACDFKEEIIEERRKQHPEVRYVTNYDELIHNPEIKAIVIATPAVTHYELARKALLQGKDVFIEKPMCMSIKEGEELIKLAEEKGAIIMVGHILRYHPAVVKLQELIAQGLIGEIIYVYSHRLNIGKIRTDENVWWSLAPHDISLLLMLINKKIGNFYYQGKAYVTQGVDDTALASFEFDDGVKAHIFVSWWHPFKEQKLVVIGTQGMLVFDDTTQEKLFYYPHKLAWNNGIPQAKKEEMQIIPVENREPLREEMKHFIECVKERKKPKTDGYEGLRVVEILEKVSIRSNRLLK